MVRPSHPARHLFERPEDSLPQMDSLSEKRKMAVRTLQGMFAHNVRARVDCMSLSLAMFRCLKFTESSDFYVHLIFALEMHAFS